MPLKDKWDQSIDLSDPEFPVIHIEFDDGSATSVLAQLGDALDRADADVYDLALHHLDLIGATAFADGVVYTVRPGGMPELLTVCAKLENGEDEDEVSATNERRRNWNKNGF